MYIPFLFSSKRDTLLRKQKAYVFHFFFFNSNCNVFENGCICIYIGALGSVSVMGKKYVLALWQYNARDWLLTHMEQKRPCFKPLNCAFPHNKLQARTRSVSLIFYLFFDFFLSFEFFRQNYLCPKNKYIDFIVFLLYLSKIFCFTMNWSASLDLNALSWLSCPFITRLQPELQPLNSFLTKLFKKK